MSRVLTYINQNQLPCRTWLNGLISSSFNLSTSTFVWLNSIGNTAYDFIQPTLSLQPTIEVNGVKFTGTQRLVPRNNNIFTSIESYSLIFLTYRESYSNENTLLSVGKTVNDTPEWLEYSYNSNNPKQQFSLVNIQNNLLFSSLSPDIQVWGISHDIKKGISEIKIDSNGFTSRLNSDKGFPLSNYPGIFYLGNSINGTPFNGNLAHFLMFSPAITQGQLEDLIELLLVPGLTWDNLLESDWNVINEEEWNNIQ